MKKIFSIRHFLPFLFIVFCALIFRVAFIDYIEFKTDEAINVLLSIQPFLGHGFPVSGTVSSIGILNPPFFNYLLLPIIFFSSDPRWISFVIGFINAILVGFFFLIVCTYYSPRVAYIASLLLAFSPWAILFSRKIWMQDLILLFLLPLLYILHVVLLNKAKRVHWIFTGTILLFLIQLHQSAIFLFVLICFLFFVLRIKIDYKNFLLGISIGLLPLLPYIIYQLANGCPDCQAFLSAQNKLIAGNILTVFSRPLQILGQGDFYTVLGNDIILYEQKFPLLYKLRALFYIEYILLPLGMFFFWQKEKKFRFFVYLVLLLPVVYFIFRITPFIHYYIIIFPLLFIFLSFGIEKIMAITHKKLAFIGYCIVVMLVGISILFTSSFFTLLISKKSINGDYGTAYIASKEKKEKELEKFKKDNNFNQIFLASFIPFYVIDCNSSFTNFIYKTSDTTPILAQIEKKLQYNTEDPRDIQRLYAFYACLDDTKTITDLRHKAKYNMGYKTIYKALNTRYLTRHYLVEYTSDFGFTFRYPQHWRINQTTNKLIITGDNVFGVLEPINATSKVADTEIPRNAKAVEITSFSIKDCIKQNVSWCQTTINPIPIGIKYYTLTLATNDLKKHISEEEAQAAKNTFFAILSSVYFNND